MCPIVRPRIQMLVWMKTASDIAKNRSDETTYTNSRIASDATDKWSAVIFHVSLFFLSPFANASIFGRFMKNNKQHTLNSVSTGLCRSFLLHFFGTKYRSLAPVHKHSQSLCNGKLVEPHFSFRYVNCMMKKNKMEKIDAHHINNRLDPRAVIQVFLKEMVFCLNNKQKKTILWSAFFYTSTQKRNSFSFFTKYVLPIGRHLCIPNFSILVKQKAMNPKWQHLLLHILNTDFGHNDKYSTENSLSSFCFSEAFYSFIRHWVWLVKIVLVTHLSTTQNNINLSHRTDYSRRCHLFFYHPNFS